MREELLLAGISDMAADANLEEVPSGMTAVLAV